MTQLAEEGETQRLPKFLPDGRRLLYMSKARKRAEDNGVWAFDPDSGTSKRILEGETEALYVEPGYLAFASDTNLMLQPFDSERLERTGTPTPIASGVQYDVNRNFLNLDLSVDGRLVYQAVRPARQARLAWLDRSGNETPIPAEPGSFREGTVSPDGRRASLDMVGDLGELRLDHRRSRPRRAHVRRRSGDPHRRIGLVARRTFPRPLPVHRKRLAVGGAAFDGGAPANIGIGKVFMSQTSGAAITVEVDAFK